MHAPPIGSTNAPPTAKPSMLANTLKHWYSNFVKNRDKIIEMFDERFFRMWEFYLLVSQYSFENMGNVVFQILITKDTNNIPLTRNYMYN